MKRNIHWIIAVTFFVIPFFWLQQGNMDLGGDSSRLYFYDPISYIKHVSIYHQVPEGLAPADPNTYYLPYASLLAVLLFIFRSPTAVINIMSGVKLGLGFLSVYWIIKTIINDKKHGKSVELSAIFAGVFYVVSPIMIGNYDKALTSHNQVFLNPLFFYFLLKFISMSDLQYLYAGLVMSFIFAPNFALTSAPPFFAFYPLALLYILLYTKFVLQRNIPWKLLCIGAALFVGIQAFHLLPQIWNLFEPGSFTNTRVFDRSSIMHEGVRYFLAVLPLADVTSRLFMLPMVKWLSWSSIITPFIVLFGFMNAKSNKAIKLTAFFYFLTLYLYAAKITDLGVSVYKRLFYIPGFSMFRNFIGQWPPVYAFYYTLLVGLGSYFIFRKLKDVRWIRVLSVVVMLLWVIGVWPFIKGDSVNKPHAQSNNVPMTFAMDPRYEQTLTFIRSLPEDGKMLTLPLTDAYYQVLAGRNGGAYIGTSTISQLTGKKDFNGYQIFGPFAEDFMKYAREKDFPKITELLSKLSIRYIFHNSDPAIYETGFPQSPYTYMKTSFPGTQKGYKQFIASLPVTRIYANGPYAIYELDASVRTPIVYVAQSVGGNINRSAEIRVTKSDPVTYRISIPRQNTLPGVLVFHDMFNANWTLSINGAPMSQSSHFVVQGYANAWKISESDLRNEKSYTMILRLGSQRRVWFGWGITAVTFIVLGIMAIRSTVKLKV